MEDKERTKQNQKTRKLHPKKRTNYLCHFLFCWELKIVAKGFKKDLNEDDLYDTLKSTDSKKLGDKLEQLWLEEEKYKKNPSLTRALIKQFGLEFLFYGLVYCPIDLAVILLQPQFLIKLLNYYVPNQTTTTLQEALIYSSVVVLLSLARVLFFHWFILQQSHLGLKARIALSSLIYRKALNLKRITFQKVTTGQIINLLSNDVYRLDSVFAYIHFIWISPLEAIAAAYFLQISLGYAALSGIGFIIVCLIIQTLIAKKISQARKQVALKTDYRIRLMNDIVTGIQVLKMYTWEKTFVKLIEEARNLELKKITQSLNLRVANNSLRLLYSRISTYMCVLILIFNEIPLTSQYIFGLINTYEFLKVSCIIYAPLGVALLSEARIFIIRIQTFLLTDYQKLNNIIKNVKQEIEFFPQVCSLKINNKKSVGVSIRNLSMKWDSSLSHYTLTKINFNANLGEVVGVIGAAGSGKSTLLQTILREVDPEKGYVEVEGLISYASQDPWVFPASIRQNILFGQEFNVDKYRRVTKVCALERDFAIFPFGDQTLVGDRGVMLSGGQKARINLARAVYRNADIYLLDDPLSAVDAHVAEHIFEECIMGYLRHKCVVLVTHQIQCLKALRKIYLFKSGRIEKVDNTNLNLANTEIEATKLSIDNIDVFQDSDLPLEIKEHRSTETASRKIYKSYCLASGSYLKITITILMWIISQAMAVVVEFFLAFLVNMKQVKNFHLELKKIFTVENCVYIYTALLVIYMISTYTALRLLIASCLNASRNLHKAMLVNVVNSTMEFFNHHTAGRILNRFSKDLGCLDEIIPLNLVVGFSMMLGLLAICISISVLNYWMIIPTAIMLVVIMSYGFLFQPTTKNLKRTEAICKSAVFTHTMASLQGLTTIRALNGQDILQKEFDSHMNLYSSAYYMLICIYNTLTFWTDLTCVIYTAIVVFSFFIFESKMYVGYIGLAITQSISVVGVFQYGMRIWSELDSQMTSVERITEYADLSPEQDNGKLTPPDNWPSEGKISFQSVTLHYPSSASSVLKSISFDIQAGEKIGIVGRTGAGKSSLVSVIFRLFHFEGQILIDGIDSKSIPLTTLRSKIAIIPQDPVLFLGTLRQNLDPFKEYSDSQLWCALEEVDLKEMVCGWASGLETVILEGGSNVSVGQRQLLCLARAILKNTKIIILDEATANIDFISDEIIQKVIRKKFQNSTVLTIAHRLNTVIDSDKILVMDTGTVTEFGAPEILLQNTNGIFYSLVKTSSNNKNKNK